MSCLHIYWKRIFFPEFAENGSVFDYIHVNHKQSSLAQRLLWLKQMAEGMDVGICRGEIYNFEHSMWSQCGLSFMQYI